jgi:hypothetical protein
MPFRVKEAFYWIMMKNGLMARQEAGRYTMASDRMRPEETTPESLYERVATFFESMYLKIFAKKTGD